MSILNYTTTIDVNKTMGEIQELLAGAGATRTRIDYENGEPTSIYFAIPVEGLDISFKLPFRWENVLEVLKKGRHAKKTEAQAKRVAARIIKSWVAAQTALISVQMATVEEVFFPYAVLNSKNTVYEEMKKGGSQLLLPTGIDA